MQAEDIKRILSKYKTASFVPTGDSMWPFIKNGKNTVVIESINDDLTLYDVVLYENANGDLVLHRIVGINGDIFYTMGDGILGEPEIVCKDNIFGVLTGLYKGKKLIDAKSVKFKSKAKKWYKHNKFRELLIKIHRKFR